MLWSKCCRESYQTRRCKSLHDLPRPWLPPAAMYNKCFLEQEINVYDGNHKVWLQNQNQQYWHLQPICNRFMALRMKQAYQRPIVMASKATFKFMKALLYSKRLKSFHGVKHLQWYLSEVISSKLSYISATLILTTVTRWRPLTPLSNLSNWSDSK